ncbi:hypothetical protein GEMRC1_007791 [Eukaryota sp. GEM-RC1]
MKMSMSMSDLHFPCVNVNLSNLRYNFAYLQRLNKRLGIDIDIVVKGVCADLRICQELLSAGASSFADSRIASLKKLRSVFQQQCKLTLLRIPMLSELPEAVKVVDTVLISELRSIEVLNAECVRQQKNVNIVLMTELGDLREGILQEDLLDFTKKAVEFSNVRITGLGVNLTCFGGVMPTTENVGRLATLAKDVENAIGKSLPIVSGGASSSLHLVFNETMPPGISHLRVGEAVFLGRECRFDNDLPDLKKGAFTLSAEIIELKDKPSIPFGEIGKRAVGKTPVLEDRGIRTKAVLAVGEQDVSVSGLKPLNNGVIVLGGSSDHTIVDVTDCDEDLDVGSILNFEMDYASMLKAFTSSFVHKHYF